ncbi:MAG: hypothetical protein ACK4E0_13800 [Chitinophagaceae bacterium]
MNYKPSSIEKIFLIIVALILAAGFVLFYSDVLLFQEYVREDGIVEWLTVAGLLLGSFLCLRRFLQLRKHRSVWFLFVTAFAALFLFFAAGEEISWGQRIFGIESSEFFKENNKQGETNLHNLIVGGRNLNKIIFSIGLVAVMAIYLLIFPILYRRWPKFRQFADRSAIPIPQFYHVVCVATVFLLTEMIQHGKRAEILEAAEALLFFLILSFPVNKYIFDKERSPD